MKRKLTQKFSGDKKIHPFGTVETSKPPVAQAEIIKQAFTDERLVGILLIYNDGSTVSVKQEGHQ